MQFIDHLLLWSAIGMLQVYDEGGWIVVAALERLGGIV